MSATTLLFQRLNRYYWPIVVSEILVSIVPFINTLMMGHLGSEALAAGGLVDSCFAFIMVLFWGVFSTVSTLIAHYRAEGKSDTVGRVMKSALTLAILLSLPVMFLFAHLAYVLIWLGQARMVVYLAQPYLATLSYAILPDFLVMTLYHFFFGLGRPRLVMLTSALLAPITIILNYLFMYGKLGLPFMGISGVGMGTFIAYLVLGFALLLFILQHAEFKEYLQVRHWLHWSEVRELLWVGVPVGLIWIAEIGFFTAVAFLMGMMSDIALAAYQIAYQAYLIIFVTFAYSMGQTIQMLLAEQLGARDLQAIKRSYQLSLALLLGVLLFWSLLVCIYPEGIIYLNLGDTLVGGQGLYQLSIALLRLMPIFLLLDSLGFATFSALRAFKDTRFSLAIVISVYWLILMPLLSFGVAYERILSPEALWLCLCLGSLSSLILQGLRFRYRLKCIKTASNVVTPAIPH